MICWRTAELLEEPYALARSAAIETVATPALSGSKNEESVPVEVQVRHVGGVDLLVEHEVAALRPATAARPWRAGRMPRWFTPVEQTMRLLEPGAVVELAAASVVGEKLPDGAGWVDDDAPVRRCPRRSRGQADGPAYQMLSICRGWTPHRVAGAELGGGIGCRSDRAAPSSGWRRLFWLGLAQGFSRASTRRKDQNRASPMWVRTGRRSRKPSTAARDLPEHSGRGRSHRRWLCPG